MHRPPVNAAILGWSFIEFKKLFLFRDTELTNRHEMK